MRTVVFGILFANLLTIQSFRAKAETNRSEGDTVIIRLKNKNQIMVITNESKNLESFKTINLNKLISDIDSTFKAEENNGNPVMLNMEIRKKDSTLRIQVLTPQLDSDKKSYKAIVKVIEIGDGERNDTTYRNIRKVSYDFSMGKKKRRRYRFDDAFEIDLGWNNYLSSNGQIPSDQNKEYGLAPLWSNIVTLRAQKHVYLSKSNDMFSFSGGLEVSWNNFKFDNDVIITQGENQVEFAPFPTEQKMIKSKLAICWLNIPLMLHYRAPRSSFHIAAGGFAGYRLTSWSKTKYEVNGNEKKDHVGANFFLNSFQYGTRVQIGFFGVDLFAQYNFNELFSKGKGPILTPFAFGFTL
jgi:hypothetical protein